MPDIFVAKSKKSSSAPKKKQNTSSNKIFEQASKVLTEPVIKIKNPVHIFASFCPNPGDITFQNQEPDEEVLLFVRKDFITNVPWIVIGGLLLVIPLVLSPILTSIHLQNFFLPARYILFFTLFYYLIVGAYIFVNFITWFFNIGLVTNIRVVDVDFSNLVYKNVAATKIDLIQDVSFSQIGVLRTVFDYGDVFIQTAGTLDNFTFEAVPRPNDVVHIIEELIGKGRGV